MNSFFFGLLSYFNLGVKMTQGGIFYIYADLFCSL